MKTGRRKGSHNRGYFHRKGRGWFVRAPGEPKLCDLQENHLKSPAQEEEAAAAYARYLAGPPPQGHPRRQFYSNR